MRHVTVSSNCFFSASFARRRVVFAILTILIALHPAFPQSNSWLPQGNLHAGKIVVLAMDSTGMFLAGTESQGVFRSTDKGATWTAMNTGLYNLHILTLFVNSDGERYVSTDDARILRSAGADMSWTSVVTGSYVSGFVHNGSGTIYGCTTGGSGWVIRSTNNGANWERLDRDILIGNYFSAIAINATGDIFLSGREFWSTFNDGQTWWMEGAGGANAMIVSPFGPLIEAGNSMNEVYGPRFGFWTDDGTNITNGLPGGPYLSLAADPAGQLFVGTQGHGVYHSTYNGEQWTSFNTGNETAAVTALLLDHDGLLYAASDSMTYRTQNPVWTLLPPVHGFPRRDTINVRAPLTLRWRHVAGAVSYHVQVSPDSTFQSQIAFEDSTIADTTVTVNNLDSVKLYYWRVHSKNGSGISDYSIPWRFITGPPPRPPEIVAPADTSMNVLYPFTFRWRSVSGANGYVFETSNDGITFYGGAITDTFQVAETGAKDQRIYWHVASTNVAGAGQFSAVHSFKTAPEVPDVIYPVSPSWWENTNQPVNIAFHWTTPNYPSHAEYYELVLARSEHFVSGSIVFDTLVVQPSDSVSGLQNNTTYYWKVRGWNAGGAGSYSAVWSFTTIVAAPATPVLIEPADRAERQPTAGLRFSWHTGARTETYHLQISTDSLFVNTNPDVPGVVVDAATLRDTISSQYFARNTVFYWRVRGENIGGVSAWSSVNRFKTVNIDYISRNPNFFGVSQNYPNPVKQSPTTLIQVIVPELTHVVITIFDVRGAVVSQLIDNDMPQGYYEIPWNTSGLASGMYFYSAKLGKFSTLKKIVIAR